MTKIACPQKARRRGRQPLPPLVGRQDREAGAVSTAIAAFEFWPREFDVLASLAEKEGQAHAPEPKKFCVPFQSCGPVESPALAGADV